MIIEFLRLDRGKKWKIVKTLNDCDKVLTIEKKQFYYYTTNDDRLGKFITLDEVLNYARMFGYHQVQLNSFDEN